MFNVTLNYFFFGGGLNAFNVFLFFFNVLFGFCP